MPDGTTLLEIVGLDPIVEGCTYEITEEDGTVIGTEVWQGCVEALGGVTNADIGFPLPINNGGGVTAYKLAGSCVWEFNFFNG